MKEVKIRVKKDYDPESDNINFNFDNVMVCENMDNFGMCLISDEPCPFIEQIRKGIWIDCIEF